MKKFLLIISIVILSLTTACGNKLTTYTEISYTEYLEKIENEDTFPLVIGSESCSACALFKGTMETIINDYQVEVFYIDISKVSDIEYSLLKTQISFDGTPTTIFIKDGELTSFYNRLDGAVAYSKVKQFFKDNNYME